MRALQFATATANLASQNAFLFLATHGPIFIASSFSATLMWVPVLPLELLPNPPARCEDDRYKVHTTLLGFCVRLETFFPKTFRTANYLVEREQAVPRVPLASRSRARALSAESR